MGVIGVLVIVEGRPPTTSQKAAEVARAAPALKRDRFSILSRMVQENDGADTVAYERVALLAQNLHVRAVVLIALEEPNRRVDEEH